MSNHSKVLQEIHNRVGVFIRRGEAGENLQAQAPYLASELVHLAHKLMGDGTALYEYELLNNETEHSQTVLRDSYKDVDGYSVTYRGQIHQYHEYTHHLKGGKHGD